MLERDLSDLFRAEWRSLAIGIAVSRGVDRAQPDCPSDPPRVGTGSAVRRRIMIWDQAAALTMLAAGLRQQVGNRHELAQASLKPSIRAA
jgi:hypothetical protein